MSSMRFHFFGGFLEESVHVIYQHAKGRRRKNEVPTDSQPQFELGDTAEDIGKRRSDREMRGRDKSRRRQRSWNERG